MSAGNSSRTKLSIYSEAVIRRLLLNGLANTAQSMLVTEFPKSGGTWVGQLLSEAAGIPFPRNAMPRSRTNLFHGHYLEHYSMRKVLVLWRDPRDIIVSWYYHTIIGNQHANRAFIQKSRESLDVSDIENIRENLPKFIDMIFTKPISPKFNWNDFVDCWYGRKDIVYSSYEAFKLNPVTELERILAAFDIDVATRNLTQIVEKYSFKNQTGRVTGSEEKKSFLRKGIVGDWKNHFSPQAIETFNAYAGNRIEKLGYKYE